MSDYSDEGHIDNRANLLPEEQVAGSEDPEEQARAILEDSLERTDHPEDTHEDPSQPAG